MLEFPPNSKVWGSLLVKWDRAGRMWHADLRWGSADRMGGTRIRGWMGGARSWGPAPGWVACGSELGAAAWMGGLWTGRAAHGSDERVGAARI